MLNPKILIFITFFINYFYNGSFGQPGPNTHAIVANSDFKKII